MSPPTARRRPEASRSANVVQRLGGRGDVVTLERGPDGFVYLPVEGGRVGVRAIECPGDLFVCPTVATDEDWRSAAELAQKRLRRCRAGSGRWWSYTAVITEQARRRRGRLAVLPGGAA